MRTKTLAVTGLSGVIGSALLNRIKTSGYRVVDLFHEHPYTGSYPVYQHIPFNLLERSSIATTLSAAAPDKILHLAAITHIDACEKDMPHGKNGVVWRTNVEGTREIARYGKTNNVPVIYLSTECVFDGRKDFYDESAKKNPKNWYGQTKSEAEDILLSSDPQVTVIRAAIAYHRRDKGKTFFGAIYSRLKNNQAVHAVTDQLITPTHSNDIARAIAHHVTHGQGGIFHVSSNTAITPYAFAKLIAQSYGYPQSLIHKITLNGLYGQRRAALRLRHACLWSSTATPTAKNPAAVLGLSA